MGFFGRLWSGIKSVGRAIGRGVRKAVSFVGKGVGGVRGFINKGKRFLGRIPIVGGVLEQGANQLLNAPIPFLGGRSAEGLLRTAEQGVDTAEKVLAGDKQVIKGLVRRGLRGAAETRTGSVGKVARVANSTLNRLERVGVV